MGRIIHIEFTSDDPEATAAFFAATLGWKSEQTPFPGYLMAATGPGEGIDGAVMRNAYQRQPVIAWHHVDDIARAAEAIVAAGGVLVDEIHELPDRAKAVYFTDPDGVLHALKEPPAR